MNYFYLYKVSPQTFIAAKSAASSLGITSRRLRVLAVQGRVEGAIFVQNKGWQFSKYDIKVRPGKRGPAFGLNNQNMSVQK
jgi:hypothetical protein